MKEINIKEVYSNEAHLLLLIVVIRTITKIEKNYIFYIIVNFTSSVSEEPMSM